MTPQPVAPESASGNYVALDLGGGRFAFYEHLQQGSIMVKPGSGCTRGEVIAKLGSSGSTSIGPHLHFHVADANVAARRRRDAVRLHATSRCSASSRRSRRCRTASGGCRRNWRGRPSRIAARAERGHQLSLIP